MKIDLSDNAIEWQLRAANMRTNTCSRTLPMLIFSKVKLGVTPDINALATLIIVIVSLGVLAAYFATRRLQNLSN